MPEMPAPRRAFYLVEQDEMSIQKPGRNDPCPCGSGKKYKQCCQQHEVSTVAQKNAMLAAVPNAMRMAVAHHRAGRLPQAEAIYQQVLGVMPRQPDALHLLGAIALANGNIPLAVEHIKKAISINPANPEYYSNLGFALHEHGQLEDAVAAYRKALSLKPDYAGALYNMHALLLPADPAAAVANLNQVLSLAPQDLDARFMLAVLLDYTGDAVAAEAQFKLLENGGGLTQARLDAWRYLKSANPRKMPPIVGSMMQTFKLALDAAPKQGLVLEFGVRFGNTIRQIAGLARQPVHGFDSFEGLPEVWHHEPKGSYTTKGEIPKVPPNVQLHVGWFEDTLPVFLEKRGDAVRFINIDCDIYSSTKTVLELLAPRMVVGSVLVFDEYIGNEHWRDDEFKAFQEAVARYGWAYEYLCFSVFTKQVAVRITALGKH